MLSDWQDPFGLSSAGSTELGAALGFAAALGGLAMLLRRRLPAGVADGTIVATFSGVAVLFFLSDTAPEPRRAVFGHVMSVLALLWYVIGRWRRYAAPADDSVFFRQAALICGCLALWNGVQTSESMDSSGQAAGMLDLVALQALALGAWAWTRGRAEAVAALAVAVTVAAFGLQRELPQANMTRLLVFANALGGLALLTFLATVIAAWLRRRRQSIAQPQRLTEAYPNHTATYLLVIVASSLAGVASLALIGHFLAFTAVFITAIASLSVGHVRRWMPADETGMVLVTACPAALLLSLGWGGWSGALFAVTIAGGYALWLARFWDQQLLDDVPWTTAGRLIPVARRCSFVAAVALLPISIGAYAEPSSSIVRDLLSCAALLGFVAMQLRDADWKGGYAAAAGAFLAGFAAAVPLHNLLRVTIGWDVSLLVLIAAVASLVGLRIALIGPGRVCRTAFRAYIGAALPVGVLFVLTVRGFDAQTLTAAVLTASAIAAGNWSASARPPVGTEGMLGESDPG